MKLRSPRRNTGLVAGLMLALLASPAAAQPLSRSGSSSHDHSTVAQGGTTIAPKILSQLATSTATLLGRVTISTFTASSATITGVRVTGAADLGSLTVRGQETVVGTMTAQGNAFSVGATTLAVVGGNVGIGTASPAYELHIKTDEAAPNLSTNAGSLAVNHTNGIQLVLGAYPTSPYAPWLQTKDQGNGGISYPLSINPLGGNVGIGVLAPTTALSVYGVITSSTTQPTIICSAGTATFAPESTDQHGRFTNTAATYCDLTFSVAWPKTPSCFCNNESANMVVNAIPTTTTLRCNSGAGFGGHTISYMCMGAP